MENNKGICSWCEGKSTRIVTWEISMCPTDEAQQIKISKHLEACDSCSNQIIKSVDLSLDKIKDWTEEY